MTCPCCKYPTLTEAVAYEICELCNWEDDGQGEAELDEVWGGPNGDYSLAEARRNFHDHLVMYAPDRNKRLWQDSALETETKRSLVTAFDRLKLIGEAERPALVVEIHQLEAALSEELDRRIKEYESRAQDD